MSKLDECREQIDLIDTKIIELYEKRMAIVEDVIKYKIENNMPVLDSSRENLMLEKNIKKIMKESYKIYYEDVLKGFLKASKDMQKDILNKK